MSIEFIREQCAPDPIYELTRVYIVQMYNVTNRLITAQPCIVFTLSEWTCKVHPIDDLHMRGA